MWLPKLLLKVPKTRYIQLVRKLSQTQNELHHENLAGDDTGITIIALNRPKQKNALGKILTNDLRNALQKTTFDSKARVLIIRSIVPEVFCAGADLKERLLIPPEEVPALVSGLRSLLSQIENLPIPVIAAIDGVALGGGLEMSLACDIRIASNTSKMGLVEGKLAIIPGAGGTQRLPRLIGAALAKELIFTAKIIDGELAHRLGVVNHVVPQNETGDAAYKRALNLAREILPNGPVAMRMAKKAVNRGMEVDINIGLAIEEACYAQVVPTEDRVEGLRAFTEKRKPNYIGR